MSKKAPTKAERKHLDQVAALGCIVSLENGMRCESPATIHHPTGAGMARKASHYDAIPLCPTHHQHGGYGVAIHAGQKAWEANFGLEADLLQLVRDMLGQQ